MATLCSPCAQSLTLDGPSGGFIGYAVGVLQNASSGRQVLLLPASIEKPGFIVAQGQTVVIISGPGAGQYRRVEASLKNPAPVVVAGIKYAAGVMRYVTLDAPMPQPFDLGSSSLSVLTYKGRITLEGNRWVNGSRVQTFGTSLDTRIVGNSLENISNPFPQVFGQIGTLNMVGTDYNGGLQPNTRTLVEQNSLWCSSNMTILSQGALATGWWFHFGHTIRRNRFQGGVGVSVQASLSDMVWEDNEFSSALCPVNRNFTNIALMTSGWEVKPPGAVALSPSSMSVPVQSVMRALSGRTYAPVPLPTPTVAPTMSATPAATGAVTAMSTITPSQSARASASASAFTPASASATAPASGGGSGDLSGIAGGFDSGSGGRDAVSGAATGRTGAGTAVSTPEAVGAAVGGSIGLALLLAGLVWLVLRRSRLARLRTDGCGPVSARPRRPVRSTAFGSGEAVTVNPLKLSQPS